MKNRSIPLAAGAALLGLAASAHAQSNVTVSGFIDAGVYRNFDRTKNVGTIQRSHLAFSGGEDLGGGMAATFRLSHRFDVESGGIESGGKPFWHDEATVGLKGGFGHLRLGRALSAIWSQDWAFDPWSNFNRIASPAWQFWHYYAPTDRVSNGGAAEYGRVDSGLFYDSPSFGGVTLHLSGSPQRTAAPGNGHSRAGSLVYANGAAGAMLGVERNGSGDRDVFLAGKYGFGALTLMGAYNESRQNGTGNEARVASIGAAYAMGATTLKASYARLDLNHSGDDRDFVGLGADYALSKRTTVYASLGHIRPEAASSQTAYGVGIAHAF